MTNATTAISAGNGRPIRMWSTKTTAALIDASVTEPMSALPTDAVIRSVMSLELGAVASRASE